MRHPMTRRSASRGFTLIELLVTIAVAAILATLAAPSFRQYITTQRIRNASFDLITGLTMARSEALTRNADVDFKQSGGSWANGWTVVPSGTTTTLHQQDAFKGLTIIETAGLATITYGKDGRAVTGQTTFTIKPSAAIGGVKNRCITVGLSGLPKSTETTGTCP